MSPSTIYPAYSSYSHRRQKLTAAFLQSSFRCDRAGGHLARSSNDRFRVGESKKSLAADKGDVEEILRRRTKRGAGRVPLSVYPGLVPIGANIVRQRSSHRRFPVMARLDRAISSFIVLMLMARSGRAMTELKPRQATILAHMGTSPAMTEYPSMGQPL